MNRSIILIFFLWMQVNVTSAQIKSAGTSAHTNIAFNRACYQSTSIDDDNCAHLASDGSKKTYWQGKSDKNQWIYTDLGVLSSLTEINIHWGNIHATSFSVDVSSDLSAKKVWQTIYSNNQAQGSKTVIPLSPTKAQFVRIHIYKTNKENEGAQITELEVHAPEIHKPAANIVPNKHAENKLILNGSGWKVQNAMFVNNTPSALSTAGYNDKKWLAAQVPGTVLGSYVNAGAVPDPWFGDQMSQISESFFSGNDFWYRNSFVVPETFKNKQVWIAFDGINWKAEVYFNGTSIGKIDGAFTRGRFEISKLIKPGQQNYLAVLIKKQDHPGTGEDAVAFKKVLHKTLGARTTNGGMLGYDSPAILSSIGWNWIPIIRGRNAGIWNEVRLEATGRVNLVDPWVSTEVSISETETKADLKIQTTLSNSTQITQTGTLVGEIGNIKFSKKISLAASQTKNIVLDKNEFAQLTIQNPKLWWPNGYGDPQLHKLKLTFKLDNAISDEKTVVFGIRKIDYKLIDGNLTFFVNNKRILVRGGNWGNEEGMLNCDSAGYDLRVRLHRDANMVMIRNWVGMVGREEFYNACDRYGILIWDDFWLANPNDGPNPLDEELFMANVHDKIKRVRSHASLALYCGRNEGYPPASLDSGMKAAVEMLDGTRHYIPNSAAGTVTGLGPYDVKEPEWYFTNRGKTFHSEQGIIAVPPLESMKAMMPEENLWPINDMWAVHDYQSPRADLYTKRIEERYGVAKGIEDYCKKAQMLNLETGKAIYECLQDRQGSGMLIWMTQAAWPSLICQLYDHYFEPTGAYFGAKKGSEPVHILWNAATDSIKAVNNTVKNLDGLVAEAIVYDINGKEKWRKTVDLNLSSTSAKTLFALQRPEGLSDVFFIKLKLSRGSELVSDNFYWTSLSNASCRDLEKMPSAKITGTATKTFTGKTCQMAVTVHNAGDNVALMIRLKLKNAQTGERLLPVIYDDNYFSLLPGEKRVINLSFDADLSDAKNATLIQESWNTAEQEIAVN